MVKSLVLGYSLHVNVTTLDPSGSYRLCVTRSYLLSCFLVSALNDMAEAQVLGKKEVGVVLV